MSQVTCVCNGAPLNPGTSSCIESVKTWDYLVMVDYADSTGAVNSIPAGTVINEAYVLAKVGNADPTVKWYVFPKLWTIEDLRADPLTESLDNIDFILEDGPRTFTGFHIGKVATPQMVATYDSRECRDNAVFGLTSGGQIEGNNPDLLGDLEPIKIQNETLKATYIKPTKTPTNQKVQVRFTVDETETDSCLDFISSTGIAYATTNWYSDAPIDVEGLEVVGSTTTQVVFKLKERFGPADDKNKIEGILSPDFDRDGTPDVLYNVTDSANVPILTVTEAPAGTYTVTFALQDSADVISIDVVKVGLDMVTPLEIPIP